MSGQPIVHFAILFGYGLRPGEALALLRSDYDGEELQISKQITRRRIEKSTKTSVRRRVYVPTWVRDIIDAQPVRMDSLHFFVNSQGGYYRDSDVFNAEWYAAHDAAKIHRRIPYTCRHTRAAEMLSAGIDPADAAKQLGHSVEMFLRTYSEFIEEYATNRDKSRFECLTDKKPTNIEMRSA